VNVVTTELRGPIQRGQQVGRPEIIEGHSATMPQWLLVQRHDEDRPFSFANAGEYSAFTKAGELFVINTTRSDWALAGGIEDILGEVIGKGADYRYILQVARWISIARTMVNLMDWSGGNFSSSLRFGRVAGPPSARTIEPQLAEELAQVMPPREVVGSEDDFDDGLPDLPNDEEYRFSYGRPIRFTQEQTAQFRRMTESEPAEWFANALARRGQD
jgi:hypothetical protein